MSKQDLLLFKTNRAIKMKHAYVFLSNVLKGVE